MPGRSHAWPEGHWDWLIHLSHKHGLKCGPLIFVGGQVDKDSQGKMLNLYNLDAQTDRVIDHIETVLREFGAELGNLVKLVAFVVDDGSLDEAAFQKKLAARLPIKTPGPAITLVPLPWLAYPGMMVEIEAIAMTGEVAPKAIAGDMAAFSDAIQVEDIIFTSARTGSADQIAAELSNALAKLGAGLGDAVRLNLYYPSEGDAADWHTAVEAFAAIFSAPGPVITALPLASMPAGAKMRVDVIAMRAFDGKAMKREALAPTGRLAGLPFSSGLACGDMLFVGAEEARDKEGQVMHPGAMAAQTTRTMDNLAARLQALGLEIDDCVKVNAFYKGEAGPDTIVENQRIRSARFVEPGPTSTGVPLKNLSAPEIMISVDAIAMRR